MLPTFNLTVDGNTRVTSYRGDTTAPKDAVIWCHGGGGSGEDMLSVKVRDRTASHVLDFGPLALSPGYVWVHPWQDPAGANHPVLAPDCETDLRYLDALVAYITSTYPSVVRVWLSGFSSGCALTWAAWSMRSTYCSSIVGYGLGCHPLPVDNTFHSFGSPAATPAMLWNGGLDDSAGEGDVVNNSWADSRAALYAANGHTGHTSFSNVGTCCASNKTVQEQNGTGGTQPARGTVVQQVAHSWSHCSACHTDDYITAFWTGSGFGT